MNYINQTLNWNIYRYNIIIKDTVKRVSIPRLTANSLLIPSDPDSISRFLTKCSLIIISIIINFYLFINSIIKIVINTERVCIRSEEFRRRYQFIRSSLFTEILSKCEVPVHKRKLSRDKK